MSPLAAQRRRNATTDPRRLTSEALPIGLPFRVIEGRHFQVVDDSQRSSRQEHVWVAARILKWNPSPGLVRSHVRVAAGALAALSSSLPLAT